MSGLLDGTAETARSEPRPPELVRGTALNLATIAVQVLTGIGLTIAVTRSLSEAEVGRYIYLGWLASALGLLGASASQALAVRLVAESVGRGESGRARRLLARLTLLATAGVAACALVLFAADRVTGVAGARGAYPVLLLLALGQSLAIALSLGLQGAGRFDLVFRATAPVTVLAVLAAAAAALAGGPATAVLTVTALGWIALGVLLAAAFRQAVPPGPDRGGPALAAVRPYFLTVTALGVVDLVVWQKSELFFLQLFRPAEEVAIYGVAFALAGATVRMAPTALAGVLTPAFAAIAGRRAAREESALFARASAVMAALGALLAIGAIALAPSLLAVFGRSYGAAAPLLPWLAFALVAGNVSGVASAVFHGHGRADLLLKMGFVLAAVNVALDLLLIPGRGALGAAIACATAQALSLPIAALLAGRNFGLAFPLRALARVAAATAAGVAALALAPRFPLAGVAHDLLTAAIASGSAIVVYRLLGGFADVRPPVEVIDPPPPLDPAPEVTVVVPTKNRPDYLRRCLAQVLAQDGPSREIIVIDSSDDNRSALVLAAEFPAARQVRVRHYPNNRHFAKNQGIRLARGAIICFLDDDSFVEPGWLGRIVSHYALDPAIGAAAGRIIDEVFGAAPTGAIVGGMEPNGRLHLNFTRHTGKTIDVEHAIGCNLSFRRSVLARIGGFDVHYGGPNFMEETDLCLRARRAGYRVVFDPDAVVYHANAPRDAGMKRQSLDPKVEFWSARSRAYFALKLLPRTVAVLRYNALGMLKLHLVTAVRERSWLHLRAFFLQAAGTTLGVVDWVRAGFPRVGGEVTVGTVPRRTDGPLVNCPTPWPMTRSS